MRLYKDYPQSPFPVFVPPPKPSPCLLPLCVCVCVTVVTIQQVQIHGGSDLVRSLRVFFRTSRCLFVPHFVVPLGSVSTGWATVSVSVWNQRLTRSTANNSPAGGRGRKAETPWEPCFRLSDFLFFRPKRTAIAGVLFYFAH